MVRLHLTLQKKCNNLKLKLAFLHFLDWFFASYRALPEVQSVGFFKRSFKEKYLHLVRKGPFFALLQM